MKQHRSDELNVKFDKCSTFWTSLWVSPQNKKLSCPMRSFLFVMKPGCICLILNLTDLAVSCSITDQDIMLNLKASLPSLVNRFSLQSLSWPRSYPRWMATSLQRSRQLDRDLSAPIHEVTTSRDRIWLMLTNRSHSAMMSFRWILSLQFTTHPQRNLKFSSSEFCPLGLLHPSRLFSEYPTLSGP